MNNFIIFIKEDLGRSASLCESEFQREIKEYTDWVDEMSKTGNYVSGDPLEPGGRYILKDNIQSNGPFIESKEAIGGYVIVKANNIDIATSLAKKCLVF